MRKKILILGIGNILRRDEGLGVRAIEHIKENHTMPSKVDVIDGGVGGLSLFSVIKKYSHVIIVDAINSEKPPGTIVRFTKDKILSNKKTRSLHQLGVKELLGLLELEGYHPEIILMGMEPMDMSNGLELSPLARLRLPLLVEMVKKELQRFGVEMAPSGI